ncbi:MAG: PQQ-dependent sugar dehydrogenase, partial [Coriobacteriia bacterium]|nr:PQQ-dependent sugar dehydrogenase [Coriobacteriia bacterium]
MYARNDARRTAILAMVAISAILLVTTVGCRAKSAPVVLSPRPPASDVPTRPVDAVKLGSVRLELSQIVSGLQQPLFATGSKDGSSRLFVCEKTGKVRVIENGALVATPLLDLSGSVSTDSERGLLGIAFSPKYAQNRRFYVDYTDKSGATVISRFTANANGTKTDTASEEVLLRIEQPYANHNGGCVQFGPDKMLWIGMG